MCKIYYSLQLALNVAYIQNRSLSLLNSIWASELRCFRSMVTPLSKAIIAVLILHYTAGHWNIYFSAFIYLLKYALIVAASAPIKG